MAKKKGKCKKSKAERPSVPFVAMPLHWPGKQSDPNLFEEMARNRNIINEEKRKHPYTKLRIRQVAWEVEIS